MTLDDVLLEALAALRAGARGACVVCGDEAVIRRQGGVAEQTCRTCGSVLEDGEPGAPVAFRPRAA